MSEQLKQEMAELESLLLPALDKALKDTRTKSGKNMFDIHEEEKKFPAVVANKLIEAKLMDEDQRSIYIDNDQTFFFLEFDSSENRFTVCKDYDELPHEHLKEALFAIEAMEPKRE